MCRSNSWSGHGGRVKTPLPSSSGNQVDALYIRRNPLRIASDACSLTMASISAISKIGR